MWVRIPPRALRTRGPSKDRQRPRIRRRVVDIDRQRTNGERYDEQTYPTESHSTKTRKLKTSKWGTPKKVETHRDSITTDAETAPQIPIVEATAVKSF